MKCINHPDRDAVANCKTCGRGLCQECASKRPPLPQCIPCFRNELDFEKNEIIKSLILSTIVGIAAAVFFFVNSSSHDTRIVIALLSIGGGFGWSTLNKITPETFLLVLILPALGWIVYFVIKFLLSMLIGIFVCPYRLYTGIKRIKEINQQEKCAIDNQEAL